MQAMRVARELGILKKRSPWGISCDLINQDKYNRLEAKLVGPRDSPYESGTFTLLIEIPEKYPFEPPHVKFETPVYHPNIDKGVKNRLFIFFDLLTISLLVESWDFFDKWFYTYVDIIYIILLMSFRFLHVRFYEGVDIIDIFMFKHVRICIERERL